MNRKRSLLLLGSVLFATTLLGQGGDPPSRVARLNLVQGSVSMQAAGSDEWVAAVVNRPFSTGDYLYTDQDSRAELHFDNGVIRMSQYTSFGFLNLDDRMAQIKLAEGQFNLHVRRLGQDQSIEIDTPNAAISILREGDYRVDVNPHDNMGFVVVRQGEAEVTSGQAFTVHAGEAAQINGTDSVSYSVVPAPGYDAFDNFCQQRDQRYAHSESARYVSEDVIGYEDLDNNGSWRTDPTYGAVWYPSAVQVGWAPYRYGHWSWIEPWGWTWVDDDSWGFAPFHYGRWVSVGGGWGWVPGPIRLRPCYAPALVAFIGGAGWGVSLSLGGPSVGWVPLGWGEVYRPAYHVSPTYFQTVNVSNTVINKTVNITNVYNTTYVNKTAVNNTTVNNITYANLKAPNAVTAMPQQAFASGQPASRAGVSLRKEQIASIQPNATVVAPPVAPTRMAVAPSKAVGSAPHPEAFVMQQKVVAKTTPPPPTQPFQSKQAYLASNAGQPYNAQQMKQAVQPNNPPPSLVRPATQVKNNGAVAPERKVASGNPPQNGGNPPQNVHGVPPNQLNQPPKPSTLVPANPQPPAPQTKQPVHTEEMQRPAGTPPNRPPVNAQSPRQYPPQATHAAQPPVHYNPPPPPPRPEKKEEHKREK